jgi:hypothetical protein
VSVGFEVVQIDHEACAFRRGLHVGKIVSKSNLTNGQHLLGEKAFRRRKYFPVCRVSASTASANGVIEVLTEGKSVSIALVAASGLED